MNEGHPRPGGRRPRGSTPGEPPRRWARSIWDDGWDDDTGDPVEDWTGAGSQRAPWSQRTQHHRQIGADQPRESDLESAFGGFAPDAVTIEMRAIPDSALFEQPHSPGSFAPYPSEAPPAAPPRQPPHGYREQPVLPPTQPTPAVAPGHAAPTAPPPAPPAAPPAAEAEARPPSRKASFLVAAGILASRVAGLAREVVIANFLGASMATSAFRSALRIPNLLQNLLGEGVLSASFIPVYARLRSEGDEDEAGRLAGAVAGLLIALTGFLSLTGLLLAGPITSVITPGLPPETHDLAVSLARIMFPGVGFLVLSAWCLGVLNSHRKFFLSYVAPVLWNAAQIIGLLAVALRTDDTSSMAAALAWGVFIGGVLQLGVQLGPVLRLLGRLRLSLDARRASVRDVLRRFGPVLVSRGSVQLLAFFDLFLASFLATGAIAQMGFAQVLYLLPISLFGMSVAAAELPAMSETQVVDAQTRRLFRRRLETGMARIAFYVFPTATIFIVAGDVIVRILFERGSFTPQDTQSVWLVLAAFAVGLPAVTSSRLQINGLFALDDARTPARLAVFRVILAAAIGLFLMFPLDRLFITASGDIGGWGDIFAFDSLRPLSETIRDLEDGPPHLGIMGLALGTAVAAWFEYRMLATALAVRIGRTRLAGRWLNPIAACCMAAAFTAFVMSWLVPESWPSIFRAALVLGPAGLAYLGSSYALGVPEAKALLGRLNRLRP